MQHQSQEQNPTQSIASQQLNQISDSSLFRIMIASDNHLGYLENDQIRGDDSFNSFEEILKLSRGEGVDFLILGGDLFHHHNPSKRTIIRTSNILQKYVYGQKHQNYEVFCFEPNFKNENLSVELPIFIIHGNHDDPSGLENFSSIDIFAKTEVNYFGKVKNYEEIDLYPILFVKGNTKIALYGIGSMKDERLYLALQNKKVNFHRPDDYKNWFNILVVHQNRFKGHNIGKNKKTFLPESFIPSFFDLIIWGHEHECFTEPIYNSEVGFHVYQPGSSVATSLIQAEAKHKHIGGCEISGDKFRIIPIKLESVRPFIYNQFELRQYAANINTSEDVEKIIELKIEEAGKEINDGKVSEPKGYNDLLPIIRLKVEYSGYQMTRMNFIISKYSNKISNGNDVIQFWKKGEVIAPKKPGNLDDVDMENNLKENGNDNIEEEMQDTDEEGKRFVTENIMNFFEEKTKKSGINADIFCDYGEKTVNGNEKHAGEFLFHQFYESSVSSAKTDLPEIQALNPGENMKRDYTSLVENMCNKTEINNIISNDDFISENRNKKKAKRQSNIAMNINNKDGIVNKEMIHGESVNNFMNEKREDKTVKNVSQNIVSQVSNHNNNNQKKHKKKDSDNDSKQNSGLDFGNYDHSNHSNPYSRKSANDVSVTASNDGFDDFNDGGVYKKKSEGAQKRKKNNMFNIKKTK